MKKIYAPHLGHDVRLGGRRRPSSNHLYAPRLENYLRATLPAAPTATSYRTQRPDPALAQMYLNDVEGDCVIAARYHRIGQLTALAGTPFVATKTQISADYSRVGGYVPGDAATDQGCDMVTNNNDAVSHGYADGSKDLGWLVLDGTNQMTVQQAVYLFEGSVDLGIELPDAWINPFPSSNGFVWDVAGAPDPNNGHCVQVLDYDATGVIVASWGLWGWITWAAMKQYLSKAAFGESYLHLSPDILAKAQAKAPNGVAWTDLITDFDALGGHVPVPAPTPPTPPAPAPSPTPLTGPTLVEAQGWVHAAFQHSSSILTRAHAEKIAHDALAKNWPKG